jgi:hypothetical protein
MAALFFQLEGMGWVADGSRMARLERLSVGPTMTEAEGSFSFGMACDACMPAYTAVASHVS